MTLGGLGEALSRPGGDRGQGRGGYSIAGCSAAVRRSSMHFTCCGCSSPCDWPWPGRRLNWRGPELARHTRKQQTRSGSGCSPLMETLSRQHVRNDCGTSGWRSGRVTVRVAERGGTSRLTSTPPPANFWCSKGGRLGLGLTRSDPNAVGDQRQLCCETLPSRRHTEGVTADRRDRTVCWASDAEIPIGRLRAGSPVLWPCAAA